MTNLTWGVYLREPTWSVKQLEDFVDKVEQLGYHGIYTNDHLIGFDETVNGKAPYLEAWTFMTAVLMWTKRLHTGHTVLCQSFRNPALLAKMTASLDFLSSGRFELFLGAGWKEDEYLAYGYDFPSHGVRLRQLEEYMTIIRHSLDPSLDEWDFKGEFWSLKKHRNFPKPKTWPFPIHLGGSGPRFIKMAARIADGFNTGHDIIEAKRKFDLFDQHVRALDHDSSQKIKSYFGGLRIFRDENEMTQAAKDLISKNKSFQEKKPSEIIERFFWGTPEMLVEKLQQFIDDTGVKYFIFSYRSTSGDALTRFWDEIRPHVR